MVRYHPVLPKFTPPMGPSCWRASTVCPDAVVNRPVSPNGPHTLLSGATCARVAEGQANRWISGIRLVDHHLVLADRSHIAQRHHGAACQLPLH